FVALAVRTAGRRRRRKHRPRRRPGVRPQTLYLLARQLARAAPTPCAADGHPVTAIGGLRVRPVLRGILHFRLPSAAPPKGLGDAIERAFKDFDKVAGRRLFLAPLLYRVSARQKATK
ncbi:MAG: hypothetical protein BJ554DRAFT_8157, partial [Olpidium bornovanus]